LFDIDDYDYRLPAENIAQQPADKRDGSRLLVLERASGRIEDRLFGEIRNLFRDGDLLVVNDTKVFPARLLGLKETGGKVELFILGYPLETEPSGDIFLPNAVEVSGLLKCSKRPKTGSSLIFSDDLRGEIVETGSGGRVTMKLLFRGEFDRVLECNGLVPLPPYIHRGKEGLDSDRERYQTVFARETGAVAAPTAGLHFTDELMEEIKGKGVRIAGITLHVGYGTFSPVRVEDIRHHEIHREYVHVSNATAGLVNETVGAGGRIWAVGTTTMRALEDASDGQGNVKEKNGWCGLYIYPGYEFKVVDNLITNFHLPKSSLLFMVSAFSGRDNVMAAYEHAVQEKYRFYSYGDAMVIMS